MAQRSPQLLNALDLLTEQHAELDELFEQLEDNDGDHKAVLVELADKLAAHATIEEKLFYPRVMSEQTSVLLHESTEEHLAIKRVLAEMMTMDLDADELTAKLSVLRKQVSHHAHEDEEAQLFPMLRSSMRAGELHDLGNELLVMFEVLLASEPRREALNQTAEAAPPPA